MKRIGPRNEILWDTKETVAGLELWRSFLKTDEKSWRSVASKAEDRPRRVKTRPITTVQITQDIVSDFE